jgi:hypothetical protein
MEPVDAGGIGNPIPYAMALMYVAPMELAGSRLACLTHSLRCGLLIYRRLRRLIEWPIQTEEMI